MLLIKSKAFPDFVFQGQAVYLAKQAWEKQCHIDTELKEVNDLNRGILGLDMDTHWLLTDVNGIIATIHDVDKMKARQKEIQKPVSNIFWFNGDTCSINLDGVERTIYYSDTGVIDIHLKSTSLVILGGDVAKQFIAQYKAFTAK